MNSWRKGCSREEGYLAEGLHLREEGGLWSSA